MRRKQLLGLSFGLFDHARLGENEEVIEDSGLFVMAKTLMPLYLESIILAPACRAITCDLEIRNPPYAFQHR